MELYHLRQKQSLPLEIKINLTKRRIQNWYEFTQGKMYVAFSGGKDSTVLLNIVRELYPNTPAVFVNTGIEYPEIINFVKKIDNCIILRPEMSFFEVCKTKGYPIGSKKISRFIRDLQNPTEKNKNVRKLRLTGNNKKGEYCPSMKLPKKWIKMVESPFKISEQCCDILKKKPLKKYAKKELRYPLTGVMASESKKREKDYLMYGCNLYKSKEPISNPISFWTEQDILQYLKINNIHYSEIYGNIIGQYPNLKLTGEQRTGCMACPFGAHLEILPNRFQRMEYTHPSFHKLFFDDFELKKLMIFAEIPYKNYKQKSLWEV